MTKKEKKTKREQLFSLKKYLLSKAQKRATKLTERHNKKEHNHGS
jgi:hypothetical protein